MLTLSAQMNSSGSLGTLLEDTRSRIRKEPTRSDYRILLFQLYCVTGDWQRALGQLGSAATLDAKVEEMARAYREVTRCEVYRAMVFAGTRSPLLMGEPNIWLAKLLEALRMGATGLHHEAALLRNEALSIAPPTAGASPASHLHG